MKRHEQLNLFTVKVNAALLVAADSPRRVFYRIWIEERTARSGSSKRPA